MPTSRAIKKKRTTNFTEQMMIQTLQLASKLSTKWFWHTMSKKIELKPRDCNLTHTKKCNICVVILVLHLAADKSPC